MKEFYYCYGKGTGKNEKKDKEIFLPNEGMLQ